MKYLLALIPLLLLFMSGTVNATDYYYCDCQSGAGNKCVAGKDSNIGNTKLSPRRTFANANGTFNNFFAGDSIQFCRGGAFTTNEKHTWINKYCTASNVCTVTAYDMPDQESPQLAPPIITQKASLHLFSLEDRGNADHEEGYTFSNLDLRCTGCNSAGWGFYLYNDIDYVTISDISLDGFDIGVHLSSGQSPNVGSDGAQDFITLNNLSIKNSRKQGILGGADNLIISNSEFENNGGGNVFDHNIYISRGSNITIKGNDIYRSALDANNKCTSVPLVVHGTINNLIIENNTIREDIGKANGSCWGIAIDPGYAKAEAFNDVIIRNNRIINVGNIGIGIAACDNCIIENNIILQQQTAFKFTAIKAPDRSRASDDLAQDKVTIRNNSIYISSKGTGIVLGTEGTQHVVVSNAIHYTGNESFTCFDLGLATSSYTSIDNNTCYFPSAASAEWEKGSGTSPTPLGAWQQASGFGTNSQNVNPGFKDPTLPLIDLSPLSATSAVVGTGHNASSTKDYRGKTRDAQPDAGAFEYGKFNPPAKTSGY